ncbi:uncharacterized protein EI90DRAFT_3136662 [Cantharellus anzutake]|uniref:uncharacterized protein n=1 Tax=Cantharellus anzutake TaxID=1750568 RepID=UPI001908296B|nr:uncharacterized protein EI90DRAFT_3136662 [Cantharellus anzutake]KAF8313500.1 hypothetical protein EI90DRAFT_3136662 [Cantharellus anzutake]
MPSVRLKKAYSTLPLSSAEADNSPVESSGRSGHLQTPKKNFASLFRPGSTDGLHIAPAGPSHSRPGQASLEPSNADRHISNAWINSRDSDPNLDQYTRSSWFSNNLARRRRQTVSQRSRAQSTSHDEQQQPLPTSGGIDIACRVEASAVSQHVRSNAGPDRPTDEEMSHEHHPPSPHFQDHDYESSDYTTDGSEVDEEEHHLDEVVEHLDVIDPQVAVISHLSNAANSIIIPRLPLYSRRPVVTLPTLTPSATTDSLPIKESVHADAEAEKRRLFKRHRKNEVELNAHVEHVLKRRAKFRRALKAAGIVTGIYSFLCAFWGAAIVLFLVKWINLHNTQHQKFWIELSSQIENALFTLTGIGLLPWRVVDTYLILKIWHYKRLDAKLRRQQSLPPLENEDDLPDPDLDPNFRHVLTESQQRDLRRQQKRFQKSQTWYRPHATDTHRAFPITTALWICLLVDGNSFFQCFLCGCMWGLNRYNRPAWTTGLLIPASFLCAIAAGIIIAKGGSKTKKTAEVHARLLDALQEAQKRPLVVEPADLKDDDISRPSKGQPTTLTTFGGHI